MVGGSYDINNNHIFLLILRLRQFCCHPPLIKDMLVQGKPKKFHPVREEINTASLGFDELASTLFKLEDPIFSDTRKGSKVNAILNTVIRIIKETDKVKILVISQWTSFLKVIAKFLDEIPEVKYL